MSKVYKIAFIPLDAFGHVNACLGLAEVLNQLGHKCIFIVNETWVDLLSKSGFDYQIYAEEHKTGTKSNSFWNDFMIEFGPTLKLSPFEKIRAFEVPGWPPLTTDVKLSNQKIKQILDYIKADAIIADTFVCIPAIVCAGIPWIDLISCNPLFYWTDDRLPPGGSGYPTNSDKELWKAFHKETVEAYGESWSDFNSWVQSQGAPPLKYSGKFSNSSPFLNIYVCPEELDYKDIAPRDEKWFPIDSILRTELVNQKQTFEIPEQLKQKSGKLVYLSMGTMCCSELNLIRRLVDILRKSKHRFIISKGPLGDEVVLADNMWGQNSVPQLQVLKEVDLVITHGGNNTVTESLYFGKPMIVLPVFSDQFDNAQRLQEKGLGIRLDPYFCTEKELLDAIDKLVNDSELKIKYQNISERIQNSKSKVRAAQLVEDVITHWKSAQT